MKHVIFICAGLAWFCAVVSAQQTNVSAQPPVTSQKTLDDAFSLFRIATLWNKPVDWNEQEATIPQIVDHVRQNLGKEAPAIEVRGQDNTLTTFMLPQAPLGPTLTSLAELGNYQVWVFPDRLLLAPENSLTEIEKETVKQRTSGEWKRSSQAGSSYWDSSKAISTAALPLIGADIKAHVEAKGQTPTPDVPKPRTSNDHFPYEIPLGELSPTSQVILQKMDDANSLRLGVVQQSNSLDSSLTVCFDERNGLQKLELRKYDPKNPDNVLHRGQWFADKQYQPYP